MSLEISPTTFEVRDDVDDRLIVSHRTKLIPIVQKVVRNNVDVTFPNPPLKVHVFDDAGSGWRAGCWGLYAEESTKSGHINLGAIVDGLAPNLILANVRTNRTVDPKGNIWGQFIKSVLENQWLPVRSGLRLEYTSWLRRIVWLSIAGGQLRLNWKQSSRLYVPSYLDPNWSADFPGYIMHLKRPPSYQIGNYSRESESGTPAYPGTPSIHDGPAGTIGFQSTWRFDINAWLGQL